MNYSINEIRKNLLKLESNNPQGFFIEIPGRGEIVFHRVEDKIIIRNNDNLAYGSLNFDRDNLNKGENEAEKDYLFSIFLETVKENHLSQLGL
ncbi:MAG: hypothetical protein IJ086_02110 [Clostridium sp.]|nr:hypothetical protein [Clostridium sp.]